MKKVLLIISVLFCCLYIFSCDDSGIMNPSNNVSFSSTNLRRLNQETEGMYEAFVSFPSYDHGNDAYYSLGKFNMSEDGLRTVNAEGNDITLKFLDTIYNITLAQDVIISIEPPGDIDTVPSIKFLGGAAIPGEDVITANLSMEYGEILGNLITTLRNETAGFILQTPTTDSVEDYYKGLWFCDMNQQNLLNQVISLPDTADWQYEAWVKIFYVSHDTTLSLGKFTDPTVADLDGAGIYAGTTGNAYSKPGQDWITYPAPGIDLRTDTKQVFITLEPKNESPGALLTPFFLKIFLKDQTIGNVPMGQVVSLSNVVNSYLPTVYIKVSKY